VPSMNEVHASSLSFMTSEIFVLDLISFSCVWYIQDEIFTKTNCYYSWYL
jgi:hypothetical protein